MKRGRRGKGKGRKMEKENNKKEESPWNAGKSILNRLAGEGIPERSHSNQDLEEISMGSFSHEGWFSKQKQHVQRF